MTASPETQLARVVARGGLTRAQAEPASGRPGPLADKLRVATHVIENDGDLTATEAQVDRLLAELSRPA